MQGVLAQAKNGEELFSEDKFHTANGKAQACTQGALHFFLLSFGEDIFSFSPGSQSVPTMFLSSSQCVPQHVLHISALLSHMPWQILSTFH